MPKPKHKPLSDDQLEAVADMILGGVSKDRVAQAIGIGRKTLERHYAAKIEKALDERTGIVARSLMTAIKNGDTTGMIFYLKTQGRWATKAENANIRTKSKDLAIREKELELKERELEHRIKQATEEQPERKLRVKVTRDAN